MKSHKEIKKSLRDLLFNYQQLLQVISTQRKRVKDQLSIKHNEKVTKRIKLGLRKLGKSKKMIIKEIKDLTMGKQSVYLSEAIYRNTLKSAVMNIKTMNKLLQ